MRILLPILLAGCAAPEVVLYTFAPLPGSPRGIASGPDGNLLVQHEEGAACCRVTAFVPSASTEVFGRSAGPGRPMVSDDRAYTLSATGVVASRGQEELWTADGEGEVVASGSAAVTPTGTVIFATVDGSSGQVHGYTRLGQRLWTTEVSGSVVGAIRSGADSTLYLSVQGSQTLLLSMAGESGAVLWSEASSDRPLAVLDEGVLVDRDGRLAMLAPSGLTIWESDAAVGQAGIALTHDGVAWAVGPQSITRVEVATGTVFQELGRVCSPMTYGADNAMWAVCDASVEDQVELTRIGALPTAVSEPFGGEVSLAPLLLNGSAFVLVGGDSPRLLGFSGAPPQSTSSPWSTAFGVANTGRPD